MKSLFIASLFFLCVSASAGVEHLYVVSGVVKSFDATSITIQGPGSKQYKIPRASMGTTKFVSGDLIEVQLPREQIIEVASTKPSSTSKK